MLIAQCGIWQKAAYLSKEYSYIKFIGQQKAMVEQQTKAKMR